MADDEEEHRRTHVIRVYGEEGTPGEDFWVDVEVMDRLTFNGLTWRKDPANQWQQTTSHYLRDEDKEEGRDRRTVRVTNPQNKDQYIDFKINAKIDVEARGGFQWQETERSYYNESDNDERTFFTVRIPQNHIAEDWLTEKQDQKGRTTKQPPWDPDDYLNAVFDTDDMDKEQHLDIELLDQFEVSRASGHQFQQVVFNGIWTNGLILKPEGDTNIMPGVEESPAQGADDGPEEVIRLDPLQCIVNFGIGGLAVEFGNGDEDAPGDGRKKKKEGQ